MANFKWADVAHMYLKSGIDGRVSLPGDRFIISPLGYIDASEYPKRKFTPILRHLEDMTEEEARELFKVWGYRKWEETNGCFLGYTEKQWYSSWKFNKTPIELSVNEFHWLISKGFDMFGLIEAGEAIRKQ